MINFKKLMKSFVYAVKGLAYVWRVEQNFRIQSLAALMVLILALYLKVTKIEVAVLLLVSLIVLLLEILNTVFEHLVDLVKPRLNQYVKIIKDIMAAAVLISAFFALIIGLIILLPYLI